MNTVHLKRYNFRNEYKDALSNQTLKALIEAKINHDCVYFGGEDNAILYVNSLSDENVEFLDDYPDKSVKFTISNKRNSIIINLLK